MHCPTCHNALATHNWQACCGAGLPATVPATAQALAQAVAANMWADANIKPTKATKAAAVAAFAAGWRPTQAALGAFTMGCCCCQAQVQAQAPAQAQAAVAALGAALTAQLA